MPQSDAVTPPPPNQPTQPPNPSNCNFGLKICRGGWKKGMKSSRGAIAVGRGEGGNHTVCHSNNT